MSNEVEKKAKDPMTDEDAIKMLNGLVSKFNDRLTNMFTSGFHSDSETHENGGVFSTDGTEDYLTDVQQGEIGNCKTGIDAGSIDLDKVKISFKGMRIGQVHCHLYCKVLRNIYGGSFTFQDLQVFHFYGRTKQQGYFSMIEAGDIRYAIVVLDPVKATAYFNSLGSKGIMTKYQNAFDAYYDNARKNKLPQTGRAASVEGVKAVVGDSKVTGIGFYQTNSTKLTFQIVN